MLTEYFRRPDLTAAAFHDGWYRTGDEGYFADGEIYVTGRRKDLIIVGGANVYPQDLEFLADHVPGVHPGRTVAFGVDNEGTGTEDVVVLFEPEHAGDGNAVREAVRNAIARQSDVVARDVRAVAPMWLIKTSSGKLARGANREKYVLEQRRDCSELEVQERRGLSDEEHADDQQRCQPDGVAEPPARAKVGHVPREIGQDQKARQEQ